MALLYETVRMQKKATEMHISLHNPEETLRYENKTVPIGTVIRVCTSLWCEPWYTSLNKKTHVIFHRINEGAWEKIAEATSPSGPPPVGAGEVNVHYTVAIKGVHTFVAVFAGDGEYAGSTSKEVSVGAGVPVTAGIPKEYLIGGALAAGGILLLVLALKRRK